MQGQEWCTIESDPAVFTELIKSIGVKDVQVEEIYDLNDESILQKLQPIYGLIFLFRWTQKGEKRECLNEYDHELFFANQVIQNACATQAIISVLLNVPGIDIGQELQNYKDFAMALEPKDRGLVLGNSEVIRISHNSFSRPEPFVFTGKKKAKEGDAVYHFIAYVPFRGLVYELDGLQQGPILLGETNADVNWLSVAREAIMKRIAIYQESEITFTLLAINKCKKAIAYEKLNQLHIKQFQLLNRYQQYGVQLNPQQNQQLEFLKSKQFMIDELQEQENNDINQIEHQLNNIDEQIQEQQMEIHQQDIKLDHYRIENTRRKHNYIPLILEILKKTAEKGKLDALILDAKKKESLKSQTQKQQNQKLN